MNFQFPPAFFYFDKILLKIMSRNHIENVELSLVLKNSLIVQRATVEEKIDEKIIMSHNDIFLFVFCGMLKNLIDV